MVRATTLIESLSLRFVAGPLKRLLLYLALLKIQLPCPLVKTRYSASILQLFRIVQLCRCFDTFVIRNDGKRLLECHRMGCWSPDKCFCTYYSASLPPCNISRCPMLKLGLVPSWARGRAGWAPMY